MNIHGKSERPVDRINWVDDLTVKSLIELIDRLRQTQETEQFLFREAEMDDAYRQADADCRLAVRDGATPAALAPLEEVRAIVFRAHDLVGLGDVEEAIKELNRVVEIRIGLDRLHSGT